MSVSLSSSKAAEAIIRRHPPFLGNKKIFIKPAIFQPKRNMSRPTGNAKIVKPLPNGRYAGQDQYHSLNPRLNPHARTFNPRAEGRYAKSPMLDTTLDSNNSRRWK